MLKGFNHSIHHLPKGLNIIMYHNISMAKIQFDIPEKLNIKLKIYAVKNKYVSKADAILFLLHKALDGIK